MLVLDTIITGAVGYNHNSCLTITPDGLSESLIITEVIVKGTQSCKDYFNLDKVRETIMHRTGMSLLNYEELVANYLNLISTCPTWVKQFKTLGCHDVRNGFMSFMFYNPINQTYPFFVNPGNITAYIGAPTNSLEKAWQLRAH